jgi:hypothetical protein
MHAPPIVGQVTPLAVQTLFTQQPPLAQVLAAQHGWLGPPHCAQMPVPLPVQISFGLHTRPVQQAWPDPPQSRQMPATHDPALQELPGQQAALSAPQLAASFPQADRTIVSRAKARRLTISTSPLWVSSSTCV